MKKVISNKLSPDHATELAALAAMPDDEIDTSDAPEVLDWSATRTVLRVCARHKRLSIRS